MTQIHVDVDNLWVYENEYGIDLHTDKSFIYNTALPLALTLFKKHKLKATFFMIGQDLELKTCQVFCRQAMREGHTIGNHTWSHPIEFGRLASADKKLEILRAHKKILKITGKPPRIFRGPGYFVDHDVLSMLGALQYQYNSSILPGFAQLMMKCFAVLRGGENRNKIFGKTSDIFSSTQPYALEKLTELPISVLPVLRLPIHTTFLYAFGPVYQKLVLSYLSTKPKNLIYTFHAIDFVELPKEAADFPVIPLRYGLKERVRLLEKILKTLS